MYNRMCHCAVEFIRKILEKWNCWRFVHAYSIKYFIQNAFSDSYSFYMYTKYFPYWEKRMWKLQFHFLRWIIQRHSFASTTIMSTVWSEKTQYVWRLFVRLLEHGIVSYLIIWSEYIYGGERNLQTNAFK